MRKLFALTLLIPLMLIGMASAGAHTNDGHSVTRYGANEVVVYRVDVAPGYGGIVRHGIKEWQNVDGKGPKGAGVRLQRAARTDRDVTLVIDTVCSSTSWLGWFSDQAEPDTVTLNRCALAKHTMNTRRWVMLHEMGHVLMLDHPPVTAHYRKHSVMYDGNAPYTYQSPRRHDRNDYRGLWMN